MSDTPLEPPKIKTPAIVRAIFTGIGSLVGVWAVFQIFDPMPQPGAEPIRALSIVFATIVIGAVGGGLIFSFLGKLDG